MRISKKLAREIAEETLDGPKGLIDGGIALCEYVSKKYDEELTIDQGAKLHDLVQAERTKLLHPKPTSLSGRHLRDPPRQRRIVPRRRWRR